MFFVVEIVIWSNFNSYGICEFMKSYEYMEFLNEIGIYMFYLGWIGLCLYCFWSIFGIKMFFE